MTNTNTTPASFSPESLTIKDQTFVASYSVTPDQVVHVFLTTMINDQPRPLRIKITPDDPRYPDALAAARGNAAPVEAAPVEVVQPAPVEVVQPAPVEAAPVEAVQPAPETVEAVPAEAVQPAPVEVVQPAPVEAVPVEAAPVQSPAPDGKQARGPVPEKDFIGQVISGQGWRIIFDGAENRTRVIFKAPPIKAAETATQKAGFYWSPLLKSWNKKLTFKAYRAAQALAVELQAICG